MLQAGFGSIKCSFIEQVIRRYFHFRCAHIQCRNTNYRQKSKDQYRGNDDITIFFFAMKGCSQHRLDPLRPGPSANYSGFKNFVP